MTALYLRKKFNDKKKYEQVFLRTFKEEESLELIEYMARELEEPTRTNPYNDYFLMGKRAAYMEILKIYDRIKFNTQENKNE